MVTLRHFAAALLVMMGCGCAEAEHPRTEDGGRIWTYEEVVREGAEDGTGVEEQDVCEDCCLPYVCTFFCCNQPGGGGDGGAGGGGGGGNLCASRCSNYAACGANFTYCNKYCGGCPA